MSLIIIIVLIVLIIRKDKQIENLEREVKLLKKQLSQNSSATNLADTVLEAKPSYIAPEKPAHKVKVKNEIEQKNTSILVTGSILIVLAAIVFLTTAWNSISNIFKTLVLFLFVGIFLGASKIAKDKFKLEKASKTFFYIAMAYIPICTLSISIFGLFGDFLSINGAGNYLYLGFSTVFLAILYYFISKRTNNTYLIYGSTLSQLLSVILFTLMFEERIFLVCINLLLYNLLLMLLTRDVIFKKIYSIIPVIVGAITFCGIFEVEGLEVISYLLVAINFLCLEYKRTSFAKSFAANFFLLVFGFTLAMNDKMNWADEAQQIFLTLYTLILFFIENLLLVSAKNNKNLLQTCRILSCSSMGIIYVLSIFDAPAIPSFIIGLLSLGLLLLSYMNSKNSVYKYIVYAFTNILLFDINETLFKGSDLDCFIPALTTIGVIYFEKMYPSRKDSFLPIYLAGSQAFALYAINQLGNEVSSILAIAFAAYIMYYNATNKENQLCNIVPLTFVLPSILNNGLNEELELGIMFLLTTGLTLASLYKKKANIYTLFSGIYLTITCSNIGNDYLSEILFLAWSGVHVYFLNNDLERDIFKILTTIFATMLYYTIANDLEILEYTIFLMLGYIVAGMYIIRNVLIKAKDKVDIIEYIFWGIIYFGAITEYNDATDGIIFSLLILGIIFYSYTKKYGNAFLAGIIAILVNAFALTREFWFSIPWWIYLLAIGGSLIGFAIKNEANENKISIGNVLKNIKDSCEK